MTGAEKIIYFWRGIVSIFVSLFLFEKAYVKTLPNDLKKLAQFHAALLQMSESLGLP